MSWDASLPILPSKSRGENLAGCHALQEETKCVLSHKDLTAFFACPNCKLAKPSNEGVFQTYDLDKNIRCKSCKQCNPVKKWTCSCHISWHTCPRHCQSAGIISEAANSENMPKPGKNVRKRPSLPPTYNLSYQQILSEDLRIQAKKRSKGNGERMIVLGPIKHTLTPTILLKPKSKRRIRAW